MKNLFDELRGRSLWQVFGLYMAASWMVLQVVDVIGNNFGLPDWVAPAALVLLLVGLPVVMVTAFVQHGFGGGRAPASVLEVDSTAAPAAMVQTDGSTSAEEHAATTDSGTSPVAPPAGIRRWFTWKRALLGGTAAFVGLAVVAGAWLALRAAGIGPVGTLVASGALEDRALVVLADFDGNDTDLADAATEALRVDLAQSRSIRLADGSTVEEALERMGRAPSEPLSLAVAREVAVREGAAAVISGSINRAGTGYLFSAQVVSAGDGAVLTSQRETATDESDVIPAIDRLSRNLRERVGDSYKAMRADPPLEHVTTSNLEALKLYSRAASEDVDRVTLLRQAVELDSTFAMAWRGLAIAYRNRRVNEADMIEGFTRAFELRDHLTEVERRKAAAMYYTVVDFEPRMAAAEYEALMELQPEMAAPVINRGVLASALGNHRESAELALSALALDPSGEGPGYWNSVTALVNAGRIEEAEAMADSANRVYGDTSPRMSTMVLAARGRLDEAEALFRARLDPAMPPFWRSELALRLGQFAAARGRLAEAEKESRIRATFLEESTVDSEYFETIVQAAWTDVAVRRQPGDAVARLEGALERHPLSDLDPRDRPYLELAEVFARARDPQRARAFIEDMRKHFDASDLKRVRAELRRVEGEIALAEGRPKDAIESFRRAFEDFCHICPLPGLALAYEAAGQPDSAIAAHVRYVETPYSDRFLPYTYPLGQALAPTHERLAELLDQAGRTDEAARHYARFVELWENADAELQPRVRAARDRLEGMLRERG